VEVSPYDVIDDVKGVLDRMRKADKDLRVDLSYNDPPILPFEIPPESPVIATVEQAVEAVTGAPAEYWKPKQILPTDDSDLYHWWTKGNIPGVYIGPGAIELAHISDEYVEVDEIKKAARIYALVALGELGWEA